MSLLRRRMMGKESGGTAFVLNVGGKTIQEAINGSGENPNVTDLVVTGTAKAQFGVTLIGTNNAFWNSHFPNLRRLVFVPDTVVPAEIGGEAVHYIKLGHYSFSNLPDSVEYVQIGKTGLEFLDGGYFRNDMPVPPGTAAQNIGSKAGLELVVYRSAYSTTGGFGNGALAPNTTVKCYDYLTGEELLPT